MRRCVRGMERERLRKRERKKKRKQSIKEKIEKIKTFEELRASE